MGAALAVAFVVGASQPVKAQSSVPVTTAVYHPTASGKVHAEPVRWYGGYGYRGYGYRPYGYGGRYYSYYRPYGYRPYVYRPYVYPRVYSYYPYAYPYAYPYSSYYPGYYSYPGVSLSFGYSYPGNGYYYW